MKFTEKWQVVLQAWGDEVREMKRQHTYAALRNQKYHYVFGIPAIILGGLGASSFLADLKKVDESFVLGAGAAVTLASILSGIQTFAGFLGRSEKHRSAATRCNMLGKDIELNQATPPKTVLEARDRLYAIAETYKDLCNEAPIVLALTIPPPSDDEIRELIKTIAKRLYSTRHGLSIVVSCFV